MEGTGKGTLRAKYLDWCSARLAERFLDLSAEEIYALARPGADSEPVGGEPGDDAPRFEDDSAARPAAQSPGPAEPAAPSPHTLPPLPRPTDEGYRVLVQRVTEALLRRTSLPTFEQWAEAYAETPERFDAELLGFWKDAVAGETDSGAESGEGGGT